MTTGDPSGDARTTTVEIAFTRAVLLAALVALVHVSCGPPPSSAAPDSAAGSEPASEASHDPTRATNRVDTQTPVEATPRDPAPVEAPRARASLNRAGAACSPSVVAPGHPSVDVRLSSDLGGCMPKAAPPRLKLLTDPDQVADELQCIPGRAPRVDLSRHTHAILADVMLSSEHFEIVFAVDDGTTVHVGMRRTKVCQGVMPFETVNATVLTLPAPGRSLVVHTCEPRYPTCGLVP